jgi:hemoglobin-like flavoprotein
MTEDEIELVQAGFAVVERDADGFAATFYGRLFAVEPGLRPLFRGDLRQQGAKLMAVLRIVVGTLHDLKPLETTVVELARRHRAYGVVTLHYALVGQALVWTLDRFLGDGFTLAARTAWITAYTAISDRMIQAAGPDEPASLTTFRPPLPDAA